MEASSNIENLKPWADKYLQTKQAINIMLNDSEKTKKELEDMLKQIAKDKEKEKTKPVDKTIYFQET
jgi:hypothetical protein